MDESSREVESDPGTGGTLLVLVVRDADSADRVSEECGRTLSQVERAVWSTGQLLFSELWSTGHLSADIVVGGEDVKLIKVAYALLLLASTTLLWSTTLNF
jgi:hypothetical protein